MTTTRKAILIPILDRFSSRLGYKAAKDKGKVLSLLLFFIFTGLCFSAFAAGDEPPPFPGPKAMNLTADPQSIYLGGDTAIITATVYNVSTATINASVWDGQDWISFGQLVNFSTDKGTINTSAYIVDETATVIFKAGTVPGVDTIMAEAKGDEWLLTNTTTVTLISAELDTGEGTYPSIPGTHLGIITPSQTIAVNNLCTYPSLGTGGHTEYVKIWNSTWMAEARWNGYAGDWQNVMFNQSFILYANETYNYTIRTGSYPQIIHEPSWNATGGVITCSEFVDENGRTYIDKIAALGLDYSDYGGFSSVLTEENLPLVTSPSANPSVILNDGKASALLSVHVTDDTAIDLVTIDLSPIGGPSRYVLTCYGETLFACNLSVTCDPGTYYLAVNATDIFENANTTVSITVQVVESLPPAPPPNITWNVTISATNQLEPVVVGMHPNATDGYDPEFDAFVQTPVQGKVILLLDDIYST
jgi:hypothetical protein